MKEGLLARRYVNALLGAAQGKNVESALSELINFSHSVTASSDAWKALQSPTLSVDAKEESVRKLAVKAKLSDVVLNFLLVLTRKKRLALLSYVSREAESVLAALKEELAVVVDADAGFSSADELVLTRLIETDTKKKVSLTINRSELSLGGFKATVGHVVYDGTVENAIEKFKLSFN